jgi:hypothetical protein
VFIELRRDVPPKRLDPQLMADAMVQIIPKETGLFRNVVPQLAEDMVKAVQRDVWANKIDLPSTDGTRG